MEIECAGDSLTFRDVLKHLKSLCLAQRNLIPQVIQLAKLILLMPATNAVSERSASAMRRIKTYLRTSGSIKQYDGCPHSQTPYRLYLSHQGVK